ncbi:MAG: rhodanese-like domain-containing protein [Gammaproteobacteria bacterium]|nr:rhodanese-like domain-containing protein [Gammaproteobacteria bacterium]
MIKKTLGAFLSIALLASSPIWATGVSNTIIDVRTENEWNSGHLESAVHLQLDVFSEGIEELVKDKNQKVYLYCRSGNRSGKAKKIMEGLGYANVVNAGGIGDASELLNEVIIE